MRTQSNIPIPEVLKWKDNEYLVAINHKDNGVQPEYEEGKRYEADFTIATGIDEQSILKAFERHFKDSEHDEKVIDNIEIDGKSAISVVNEYPKDTATILSVDVLKDSNLIKQSDIIKSTDNNADSNIKKLAGKIKNYVADLTEGIRTTETDAEVNQLISNGNIIITNQ